MKRTDILKSQLTNSRGRFFTAKYMSATGSMLKMNFKVKNIITSNNLKIVAEVYVPSISASQVMTFKLCKKGDMSYLAADKSKIQMSGSGML
jgi:hypothetical protein